ncbi:hypothetical protein AMJ47_02705 [Parcubacteria bacterium DG_72]|nr:MAG: hypothetical protein AMJ47_02705 [Parcubacteria bacterium DG_72]
MQEFLNSAQFIAILSALKFTFIILSFIMVFGIVILFFKASWARYKYYENYTEFITYRPYGVKKGFKRWSKVIKRIETGKEAECKMAIIEADDMLKEVFQKIGYKEEFLDDILANIDEKILPSLEELKKVHDIRNNIVHDPDYNLTAEQARNILRVYQKALSELEMF